MKRGAWPSFLPTPGFSTVHVCPCMLKINWKEKHENKLLFSSLHQSKQKHLFHLKKRGLACTCSKPPPSLSLLLMLADVQQEIVKKIEGDLSGCST